MAGKPECRRTSRCRRVPNIAPEALRPAQQPIRITNKSRTCFNEVLVEFACRSGHPRTRPNHPIEILRTPKSMILSTPSRVSCRFEGLISRWTTPREWQCCSNLRGRQNQKHNCTLKSNSKSHEKTHHKSNGELIEQVLQVLELLEWSCCLFCLFSDHKPGKEIP